MRIVLSVILSLCLLPALAAPPIPPAGSPKRLTDLRWLARPLEGTRQLDIDAEGRTKLERVDGGYLVLKVDGPGVLDAFVTGNLDAEIGIEADGRWIWSGTLRKAKDAKDDLFAPPLVYWYGNAGMFFAPVGFRQSLRIVTNRETLPRYLSYRALPKGTVVEPATDDPQSAYRRTLTAAAAAWKAGAPALAADAAPPAREVTRDFLLRPGQADTALALEGSGEVVRLEFHCHPALTGSLREVVAEIRYDGMAEPSIRLPLPDLVGLPHPWPTGRWDGYNGTLAGGLRYPWYLHTPRTYYPQATFHLNLPIPYANGMTITLVNRSDRMQFTGMTRAVVLPLSEKEARAAGRLSAQRAVTPIAAEGDTQLLNAACVGHLVGLGLFTTGSESYPPMARNYSLDMMVDTRDPQPAWLGVLPLWFRGVYGGAQGGTAVINYPRYEQNYSGLMRHFLTDPIPLERGVQLRFTPGENRAGMPTAATTLAFWYAFAPYAAPALPARAETLPYTDYGTDAWLWEAEDLALMATVRDGEVRAVEDIAHDFHPSKGKYLLFAPDGPGAYFDVPIPLPASRYVSIATARLWGPNRGVHEIDLLSKAESAYPPAFPQSGEYYSGRMLGSVPMKAPLSAGTSMGHRRDPVIEATTPMLNPAPDGNAVLRVICQTKPLSSESYQLLLDRVQVQTPPVTAWWECEDWTPRTTGDLTAQLPKYGRFTWSGWGALALAGREGGVMTVTMLAFTPAKPTALSLKGCLDPKMGAWYARVNGGEPVALRPGKDAQEVVEWTIPLAGITLPGPLTLEVTCAKTADPSRPGFRPPDAELTLDAWLAK